MAKKNEQIGLLEKNEKLLVDMAANLQVELDKTNDKLDTWYRKPSYSVPFGASIALGIVVTPLVFIASGLIVIEGIFGF